MNNIRQLKKTREDKVVLVRLDLNIEDADIKNSLRIERSLRTITHILNKGYRVILLSHRGNPKKGDKKLSLKPFAKILSQKLHTNVLFIPYMSLSAVRANIHRHRASVYILENLRFFNGEDQNNSLFAKKVSELGVVYVNDAFASCDRKRASTCAITKFLPSYAGFSLQEEIKRLSDVRKTSKKPFTLVLGGAKISDKLPLINAFYAKADYILVGGGVANTLLYAQGIPVGDSLYDGQVRAANLLRYAKKVLYPCDVVLHNKKILDIGSCTADVYARVMQKSAYVVWGGPLGDTDRREFWTGSKKILNAICTSRAIVVIGGGETTSFVLKQKKKIPKRIFLSTGGGAMLAYVSGKKLPGIEALTNKS